MGEPGGAVVVAVEVRSGVEEAFGVFTAGIGDWWPVAAYSVEPGRVEAVVLEGRAGGRLYERWVGGGEADWGQVLAWEPPARVLLAWSPSPDRPAPTAVEVRFTAVDPERTRVELEHRGWERLGDQGDQVRAGYEEGWPRVLDAFAGAATGAHHRWFARSLNGQVWGLLARPIRTPEDDARMVDAAHASQYHWREVGGPPETRGEWLVSHVYAVLGRPEPALHHARRCLELADGAPGVADFDHAYAAEAMARALACAGDLDQAATWHSRATAAGATIADDEDRQIFTDDLATGPWFGLNRR
ncbi:MAG TPA: SRPBCC domain-containing protein [Actinomycetota bacterium]|nr:SRPBCC domain-containing protein [Actinomycetota bacterium]